MSASCFSECASFLCFGFSSKCAGGFPPPSHRKQRLLQLPRSLQLDPSVQKASSSSPHSFAFSDAMLSLSSFSPSVGGLTINPGKERHLDGVITSVFPVSAFVSSIADRSLFDSGVFWCMVCWCCLWGGVQGRFWSSLFHLYRFSHIPHCPREASPMLGLLLDRHQQLNRSEIWIWGG